MTAITPTYNSFQFSTVGVGAIATGLSDIRQCIDFILRTIKGTDPLRPLFGSDVFDFIDKPHNIAIPNIKKSIFEAIDLWEKRIFVSSITHKIVDSQLFFFITYKTKDGILEDTLSWSQNGQIDGGLSPVSGIILSALIPPPIINGWYDLSFNINGDKAYPNSPTYGFETAIDLLEWAKDNYGGYGIWYLTADKLVLYLKNGIAKSATLIVSQTVLVTVTTSIKPLNPGEFYNTLLILGGISAEPAFPISSIQTVEALLFWVKANWGNFGSWSIKNNGTVTTEGDFSSDFGVDFDRGGIFSDIDLVFQTNKYTSVTLSIK